MPSSAKINFCLSFQPLGWAVDSSTVQPRSRTHTGSYGFRRHLALDYPCFSVSGQNYAVLIPINIHITIYRTLMFNIFFFKTLNLGGTYFAKKMRDSRYVTMIDPFTAKYGKWGALQALPSAMSEVFWSASILGALGKFFYSGLLQICKTYQRRPFNII